ncbi:MAG TPA: glucokinase, partial [Candidatus Eisenbacteria bacterium]|nr:glucokinase [Candidatus Eisenbacteria bacterium]
KAQLALFEPGGAPRAPVLERRLPTRGSASLEAVVHAFLNGAPRRPTRLVFGIAGPVEANRCATTNLPWEVDGAAMSAEFGAPVTLLNDLEATAWGLGTLAPADLHVLHPGVAAPGNRALIAAGTGLGESILFHHGGRWHPSPSEGGHADFAPRAPLEDELLVWLRGRYGRVSYERVLSGPGLADLHRFLRATGRGDEPAAFARRFDQADDPAAAVGEAALDGSCGRARLAVETFASVYGAEAGNLALKALALGGVYVGGGIAPHLLPALAAGGCVRAFLDKGRLSPLLARMPVSVVLDPKTAVWGAAAFALHDRS